MKNSEALLLNAGMTGVTYCHLESYCDMNFCSYCCKSDEVF